MTTTQPGAAGAGCLMPSRPPQTARQFPTRQPLAACQTADTAPLPQPATVDASGGASGASHEGAAPKRRRSKVAAAVRALLADPWIARFSNAAIARQVGCCRLYVGMLRREAPDMRPMLPADYQVRLVTRCNASRPYLMRVDNIGPRPVHRG